MESKGKMYWYLAPGSAVIAACRLLLAQQAQVILYDGNDVLGSGSVKRKGGRGVR